MHILTNILLLFWQLPVQSVTKISSKWAHLSFSVGEMWFVGYIYIWYDVHVYLMGFYIKDGTSKGMVTAAVIRLTSQVPGYYHGEKTGSILKHHCEYHCSVNPLRPGSVFDNMAHEELWSSHGWLIIIIQCGMKLLIHSPMGAATEVWEWISNFILYFTGDVIA